MREHGGLGLGLAVVKGMMELQGGRAWGRSEGLRHGAEFVVSLPLVVAPAASSLPDRPQRATRPRSILVIDDSSDGARTLADVLELFGHRVHVALDGRSGIELARRVQPEIVLCDIGLPDVSGYEIARALRAESALRATRLIAVTGFTQPQDVATAREAGFDDHVAKPLDLDELDRLLASTQEPEGR